MTSGKIVELIGCSKKSWEDAAQNALKDACKKCKKIKGIEVLGQTAKIKNNKIVEYRTNIKVAYSI